MDVSQKVIEIIAESNPGRDQDHAGLDICGTRYRFAGRREYPFRLGGRIQARYPDTVAQNMKSVRQVVDSLTRVIEGKDVSDLVAMAKSEPSATVS